MARARPRLRGRAAALALASAAAAVFGLLVVPPLVSGYRAAVAKVAQYRDAIAGYERMAAREAGLRRSIEAVRREGRIEGMLLPAGSDSGAQAAIQARIQSAAGAADADLISVEALPALAVEGFQRIGMRVQFQADVAALRAVLHALEQGQPAMVLDNVIVHAQTARAVGATHPLAVRLDAFAFKRRDS
jgi:hypothetical protein